MSLFSIAESGYSFSQSFYNIIHYVVIFIWKLSVGSVYSFWRKVQIVWWKCIQGRLVFISTFKKKLAGPFNWLSIIFLTICNFLLFGIQKRIQTVFYVVHNIFKNID